MKRNLIAFLLATLVVAGAGAGEQSVVIVNPANPTTTLPKAEVARLFLKQTATWQNGEKVVPIDLDSRSPARAEFTRAVHGRSLDAVLAYWNQKMFSGAEVPPPQKSEREVLDFVRTHPGAVGYVSASTPLQQVKVLRVLE